MEERRELTPEEHQELVKGHIINLTNRLYGAEVALDTLLEMYIGNLPEEAQKEWKDKFNEKYKTKIDSINNVIAESVETGKVVESEDVIVTPAGQSISSSAAASN